MKKEVVLKGKGFILRPLKEDDGGSVVRILNNEKVSSGISNKKPYAYTNADFKQTFERIKQEEKTTDFAIEIEGKFAGSISLDLEGENSATLGYWLDEKYWGKGIITKAIDLMIKYGKENLSLKKIVAKVHNDNPASKKVLIKNSFVESDDNVFVKSL